MYRWYTGIMKQVLIIHGGNSFNSYSDYIRELESSELDYERLKFAKRWFTQGLPESLTEFDVLTPSMPNRQNAQYEEWKIVFEKILPYIQDDAQLVGHSLGAMFLAKYLQETQLPRKLKRLILVSGGYNDESREQLGSFEVISAKNLPLSAHDIHLFHSKDDFVVDFGELAKFQADLPDASSHVFEDRGHFLQPTFPELLDLLKQK